MLRITYGPKKAWEIIRDESDVESDNESDSESVSDVSNGDVSSVSSGPISDDDSDDDSDDTLGTTTAPTTEVVGQAPIVGQKRTRRKFARLVPNNPVVDQAPTRGIYTDRNQFRIETRDTATGKHTTLRFATFAEAQVAKTAERALQTEYKRQKAARPQAEVSASAT